jgi:hypothetical protein
MAISENILQMKTERPATATLIFENGITIRSVPVWLQSPDSASLPFEIIDFQPDSDLGSSAE